MNQDEEELKTWIEQIDQSLCRARLKVLRAITHSESEVLIHELQNLCRLALTWTSNDAPQLCHGHKTIAVNQMIHELVCQFTTFAKTIADLVSHAQIGDARACDVDYFVHKIDIARHDLASIRRVIK